MTSESAYLLHVHRKGLHDDVVGSSKASHHGRWGWQQRLTGSPLEGRSPTRRARDRARNLRVSTRVRAARLTKFGIASVARSQFPQQFRENDTPFRPEFRRDPTSHGTRSRGFRKPHPAVPVTTTDYRANPGALVLESTEGTVREIRDARSRQRATASRRWRASIG
jgi:hypothetical protein